MQSINFVTFCRQLPQPNANLNVSLKVDYSLPMLHELNV